MNEVATVTSCLHAELKSTVIHVSQLPQILSRIYFKLVFLRVRCALTNSIDDPKKVKLTATAPFVFIPDGPGRVDILPSSTTTIIQSK